MMENFINKLSWASSVNGFTLKRRSKACSFEQVWKRFTSQLLSTFYDASNFWGTLFESCEVESIHERVIKILFQPARNCWHVSVPPFYISGNCLPSNVWESLENFALVFEKVFFHHHRRRSSEICCCWGSRAKTTSKQISCENLVCLRNQLKPITMESNCWTSVTLENENFCGSNFTMRLWTYLLLRANTVATNVNVVPIGRCWNLLARVELMMRELYRRDVGVGTALVIVG